MGHRVFNNCKNITVYCEAESKPVEGHVDWNASNRPVNWGVGKTADGFAYEIDIENGIVGGLIPEEVPSDISGEAFIKPRKVYTFTYIGSEVASWEYDNTLPMEVNIDDKQIHIAWNTNYGGQFVLKYGTAEKTVVVNSLF
jgi:hypothetical protein